MTSTPMEPADPNTEASSIPDIPALPVAHTPATTLLRSAWERHDVYSSNASRAQRRFLLLRRLLAYLGVLVVVAAV
ncbi:MAG: hypothetical protein ACFCVD_13525, partial [Nodosilinea sp.]